MLRKLPLCVLVKLGDKKLKLTNEAELMILRVQNIIEDSKIEIKGLE